MRSSDGIDRRRWPGLRVLTLVMLTALILLRGQRACAEGVKIDTVRAPNGGLQPQAQIDSRGRVHLIYFSGDAMHGDVFYVRSDDGLSTFSKPLRVNSQPESVVITGTIRGPHLAIGKGDRVHVAWMGSNKSEPKAMGNAIPMLYTRITATGDGFEPQRNIIQKQPGLDGGGSVAADLDGNVYVAWHAPANGKDEADRHVWVARSRDEGKTFSAETLAIAKKTGTCACCGMQIIALGKGKVYIVFRSASEMVHRDIYLLVSSDYAKTFTVGAIDPWKIGTCVMSTAAFAASGETVLACWETEEQIYATLLTPNADKPQGPLPMPGAGGHRKHPASAISANGNYLVAWTEGTGWNKGGSVAWQAFNSEGRALQGTAGRAEGLPVWGVPAVIALPDGSFRVIF